MASRVLPAPAPPQISVGHPREKPPPLISSRHLNVSRRLGSTMISLPDPSGSLHRANPHRGYFFLQFVNLGGTTNVVLNESINQQPSDSVRYTEGLLYTETHKGDNMVCSLRGFTARENPSLSAKGPSFVDAAHP
jgi:hypothetical protein